MNRVEQELANQILPGFDFVPHGSTDLAPYIYIYMYARTLVHNTIKGLEILAICSYQTEKELLESGTEGD